VRAVALREKTAALIPEWGHARFENEQLLGERLLDQGRLQAANEKAKALLDKAKEVGPRAYNGADHDLAGAHWALGRVLSRGGQAAAALECLVEARRLFEALGEQGAGMAFASLGEQVNCLTALGRLDEAAEQYQEKINRGEKLGNFRGVAVGKIQFADVLRRQRKYPEALASYAQARSFFEQHNDPKSVALAWHNPGIVHEDTGHYDEAESAYRQSLEIETRCNNRAGQSRTLHQLGNLYADRLNPPKEALTFYRQAADIDGALGNLRYEGTARNNIASTLFKLKRYDEARQEIHRAIQCIQPFGHAAEPWKSFDILHDIETATGNQEAAQDAWTQARNAYLAYRQQGGYAQTQKGEFFDEIRNSVQQRESDQFVEFLTRALEENDTPDWLKTAAPKILAI
ncbi:MAG: tetratricopeptide repeat protein, partial [Methylococcales bacterium]